MTQAESSYPVQFSVDYPDRDLHRFSTFFRIIAAIPIAIVVGVLINSTGVISLPILLMILFRRKYPRWWFDFNLALVSFENRAIAYLFLLRDEYPSTDEEQSVHLEVPYPNVEQDLNRWLPLVKWILAIPHYFVLFFLGIAVLIAVIASWFSILFTGRCPRGLFDFVVGTMRWYNRVIAYAFMLTTDRYPPFRLGV